MPDATPRPLRRDAELNRRRIIEAAREVFGARGLSATLDDVAAHAGVGVGTVYRRFPTKEELLEAAFEERLEEHVRQIEAALRAPTGWDGLVCFLRVAAETHAADQGVRDIAFGAGASAGRFERIRDRIFPLVQEVVGRAHTEGSLRSDVTAGDIPVLLMMVSEVAHRGGSDRPGLFARYLQLLIDGLRSDGGNGDLGPALGRADVERLVQEWLPSGPPRR